MVLDLERDLLVELYRQLFLTRHYDETLRGLAIEGVWSFYHGIVGMEATPIGVCANLRKDDYVVPFHRTQMGAMISKGVSLEKLTAELFGRKTGYCHGVAGTHVGYKDFGVLGKSGILAAGLPVAVGAGLSINLRGTDQVVAVFFGDGTSSEGNFHESLNMASIWKLPVLFVLENNQYGGTTKAKYALSVENLAERAAAYNMEGVTVDGNDVVAVYKAAKKAVERARKGEGPSLLECKTYRIFGYYGPVTDAGEYRSSEEIEMWKKKDPLTSFKEQLISTGVLDEREVKVIEDEAKSTVQKAVKFAIESPFPTKEEVLKRSTDGRGS